MDCHRKRKHTAAEEDSAVDRGQQQQHPHAHAHQHQHGHQHQHQRPHPQQSKKHKSEHQSGSASGAWTLPLPLQLPLALGPAPAPKRPRIEIPSYASTPTSPASTVGSTSSLALTSTLASTSTSTSTPTERETRGAPRRVRLRRHGHRAEGSSAQVSSTPSTSTPTATHHHPSPLHAHPQPQSHPQHHTLLRTLLASPHIPPLQPLITRQTLRELDPGVVLRNTVIRHDLLFDSGLQFRPRRARSDAERYWDAVRVEVETGCTCVTLRVTGSGGGTEKMDTVCVCGGLSSSSSSPSTSPLTPTSSSPPSSPTAKHTEPLPSLHPISISPNTYTLRLPSRLPALINELRAVLLVVVMPLRRVVHSSACGKEAEEGKEGGGNQEDKTWCTSSDKESQYATHALELAALVDPDAMCAAVRRGWPASFVPASSPTSSTPSSPTTAASSINSAQSHQELDPASLFARIGATLKEHCAPMRDRRVDEMVEAARKPGVGAVFRAVQMCLEVLEVMKLDIANHQLTSLRPHLLRDTPAFEAKALRIRFGHGPSALGATRTWVGKMDVAWRARDGVTVPGDKGTRGPGGVMVGKTYAEMTRNQRVFLCVLRGVVDLVFENALSSDDTNTKMATPETLYLDKTRIAKLGLEAGDAGAVYMFSVLFRSLVAGSGAGSPGSAGSGLGLGSTTVKEAQLDEMMEVVRREMRDICPGPGGLGACFVGPASASSSSTSSSTNSSATFQLTPPIVRSNVQALPFPLVPTPTTPTTTTTTTGAIPITTSIPTPVSAPAPTHLRCGKCACSASTTSTHTQTHPRHKHNVEDKTREEQEREEEMLKRRRAREDLALQVARRAGEVRRGVYTHTHTTTNDNNNENTNTDACANAEDAMDVDDHHITPPDPALVSRALQWTQTNMHADAPVAKLLLARVKEAVVDEVVEIVCGRAFFGSGGSAEVTPSPGVDNESTTTKPHPHRESKGGLSAADLSGLSMWTGRGPVGARSGAAAAAAGDGTWFSAPSSPSPTRTPTPTPSPSGSASTPSSPYPSPSPSPFSSSSSSSTPSAAFSTKHHPRLLALASNPAQKASQGMRGAVADEIRRVAERVARLAGIHLESYLGVYEEGAMGGWVG